MSKKLWCATLLLACAVVCVSAVILPPPQARPAQPVVKVPSRPPVIPGWSVKCYPPDRIVVCDWLITRAVGDARAQIIMDISTVSRNASPKELAEVADREGRSLFSAGGTLCTIKTQVVHPPSTGEVWQMLQGHLPRPSRNVEIWSVDATDGRRMANLTMSVQGSVVSPDAVAQASAICHNLASEIGLAWPAAIRPVSKPGPVTHSSRQPSPNKSSGRERYGSTTAGAISSVHLEQHEVEVPSQAGTRVHFAWLRGKTLICPSKGEFLALGGAGQDDEGYAYLTGATRDTWTLVLSQGTWKASMSLPQRTFQRLNFPAAAGCPARHIRRLLLFRALNGARTESVSAVYSVTWSGPGMRPAREFARIKAGLCSGFFVNLQPSTATRRE